jgi:hypothetical protein
MLSVGSVIVGTSSVACGLPPLDHAISDQSLPGHLSVTAVAGPRVFRAPPATGELERGPAPTFSIVIAAYNAAGTIAEAVESALAQTLPPIEVIVGDDGSTDRTAAVLGPYRERVRYFRQEHRGVAATRNAALEIARGDFFAVLDADDAYLPERLEALAALSATRPDLDLH